MIDDLRLETVSAEYWAVRGDQHVALEHAARLAAVAQDLGACSYSTTAERLRAGAALDRADDVLGAATRLEAALVELRGTRAPLEMWKSARVLALLRRRLGDDLGARTAFEESARAIRTIAAGTRDDALRTGFLGIPEVHEVLDHSLSAQAS